jgi:curved DNA-binding protein CbpA
VKGCEAYGIHRAPVSPSRLRSYHWFCLDHVREYNKAWNYCVGKSDNEIEALIREDTVGWRPTWPLGKLGGRYAQLRFDRLRDEFGLFDDEKKAQRAKRFKNRRGNGKPGKMQSAVDAALDILDLSPPINAVTVKAQYITLVKQHHPDANGGDKAAEERLKLINRAYETLKENLGA